MGVTKTQLAFLVLVVFVTFLSNHNVLAAELEKFSYDHCRVLCSDTYAWHECWTDCITAGYHGAGECASPSPNVPKKCCCQT
ncbi:unnamed protein product [Brassica oleracea var. botrytis]|uniref:Defensin-like domain-containing protein n=3 Tax=Brassica TaxID=3705 RepID=A0A3P6ASE2_BRAOL|nr:unnamed protein product [Brassica napus]CDY67056.1 BnaC03g74160D [Brassica napus]VDC94287.1 unnamed protein product [Brassica oleracea]